MINNIHKFDYLEVSGTNIDIGRAIGTKFKKSIQKRVSERRKKINNYEEYIKKTEPYFKISKKVFPNLVLEIEATAQAAEVSVADYFSINNREVSKRETPDHCTAVVGFGKDGAIIGHNEDWEGASPNALYILKATVNGTTFLGLQYKVTVPGVSATINNWGLVQCINDLNHEAKVGVPKNLLARAVLECKTLDEAENLIRNTPRASGFNHLLVQGDEVRNIEIVADKMATAKTTGESYVHTNHYTIPEMKSYEKYHTKSSEERYKRAREIIKPIMDRTSIEKLLSDTKNSKYPISRNDATLGSFIAIPTQNKIYICYGPPNEGKYTEYSLK